MAERAVFLDRDNTIIDNDGYLGDPSKVKLLTGAATALSAIHALGYRLIVVSNQSGVARGMFDERAVEAVNQEMCKQLRDNAGVHIDASYYCPFHPDAVIAEYKIDHDWRKPKPGMLKQAAADFALDLSQCWMIGDQPRDIAAGASAGTRTVLLRDPDHPASKAVGAGTDTLDVSPNFIVKTLADAARIISREGKNHSAATAPAAPTSSVTPMRGEPIVQTAVPAPTPVIHSEPSPAQSAIGNAGAIDEAVLAEKITQGLARHPALIQPAISSKLERSLDDLIIQIRQQNRSNDLMPEFSMGKLAAMIVQIVALIALFAGLYAMFTAPATFPDYAAVVRAQTALQRATVWTTAAVVLQGVVISLLLYSRRK